MLCACASGNVAKQRIHSRRILHSYQVPARCPESAGRNAPPHARTRLPLLLALVRDDRAVVPPGPCDVKHMDRAVVAAGKLCAVGAERQAVRRGDLVDGVERAVAAAQLPAARIPQVHRVCLYCFFFSVGCCCRGRCCRRCCDRGYFVGERVVCAWRVRTCGRREATLHSAHMRAAEQATPCYRRRGKSRAHASSTSLQNGTTLHTPEHPGPSRTRHVVAKQHETGSAPDIALNQQ